MHELGRALRDAGLNELVLLELFGGAWNGEDVPLILDRYRLDDPRAQLVRAFVLGEPVDAGSLPVPAGQLADAGLLEIEGGRAVARIRLAPVHGLLVAHDGDRSSDPDFVTGVGPASRTLASLTVRRPVERALDLGTGCGVEALLAARHAESVVATDVNPRALEYAALGAKLNGLSLELRLGSLFEPVPDERFDLIVANPPFVVSPDTGFVYRDSPLPGDQVSREVVRGAADHLRPGGYATILCNWICREPGESWQPLRSWVDGLGCDALLLSHAVVDPLTYATRWNQELRRDAAAYADTVGRWLDYYESEQLAGLGVGAVILRGRDGPGWVRGLDAPRPATGEAGSHVVRLFEATDRLARLSDDGELLDDELSLVPGHRLDQSLLYVDEYAIADVTMSLGDNVGVVGEIDPLALPLLFELSEGRTPRQAAKAAGVDPADAAPTIRRLLELGMLEPASGATGAATSV
jgi:methylase of polypeptide subunit release factors